MDLDFSAAQDELREQLRALLAEALPADWVGIWHQDDAPDVSWRIAGLLAERGWLTYHWPEEYGGRGGSVWDQAVIQEELFAHHEPRGGQYMGVNWIGPTLMRFGTEEQKRAFMPEIASGRVQWCQLFSEPGAGSDLSSLSTSCREDGDHFVVNGEKIWTSYANIAHRGFLLARSLPGSNRHEGISVLLIDMDAPGIEVREIRSSVGNHRFHSVTFSDVRVPRDRLLGPLHEGWSVAMSALPFERAGNARYARTTRILGFLEALLADAQDDQDGRPVLRDRVADALAFGRVAELLNHAAVAAVDRGELGWEGSAAFACNALYEKEVAGLFEDGAGYGASVAVGDPHALFGGEVESMVVRQAPTVTIQAGTLEVQLSIIAQQGLELPRGR